MQNFIQKGHRGKKSLGIADLILVSQMCIFFLTFGCTLYLTTYLLTDHIDVMIMNVY